MASAQRKVPNKLDEQYILPILFLLANVTIVIWFYAMHEYSQADEVFETYYRWGQPSIANYTRELRSQIILLGALLLITPIYLKYRKRWLLVALTLAHAGEVYYFFYAR